MLKYICQRLVMVPVVLLLLFTVTFVLIRLAPGGPFDAERQVPPSVEEALNARFNLDKPMYQQYWILLRGYCTGDMGPSFKHRGRQVNEIIAHHLPPSLWLGSVALVLALIVGLSAGIYSALRPNGLGDYLSMGSTVIGISLPAFVFGPLLQWLFAMRLDWVPVSGYGHWYEMLLPAITLSLPFAARFARLMRAGMLDVLNEDFIRTARAKGLRESTVILRHALRGGILPVISFLGPAIAGAVTGSLVVEKIFGVPGLGREFVESAINRDYTLVMGTTVVYGIFILICNLLSDVAYGLLDPRVRQS